MTFTKYNSGAMNFPESRYYAMWGNSLKAKATEESPDRSEAARTPSSSEIASPDVRYTNAQVPNDTTAKRTLMAGSLPGPPTEIHI